MVWRGNTERKHNTCLDPKLPEHIKTTQHAGRHTSTPRRHAKHSNWLPVSFFANHPCPGQVYISLARALARSQSSFQSHLFVNQTYLQLELSFPLNTILVCLTNVWMLCTICTNWHLSITDIYIKQYFKHHTFQCELSPEVVLSTHVAWHLIK